MLRDRIAKRYAKSFYELSVEQGQVENARHDIKMLYDLIEQSRELRLMLLSPLIRQHKKVSIFNKVFGGKLNKITSLFIDLLMKHGREELIPDITGEFLELYNQAHNNVRVFVVSAAPLSVDERKAIEEKIEKSLNVNVLMKERVDPSLIGGFVLKIGDKIYDASVLHALRKVRKQLAARTV